MGLDRLILVTIFAFILLSGPIAADGTYSLSTKEDVSVSDRTISYQGNDYYITEIARLNQGDMLNGTALAPPETGYYVNIYTPERQIAYSTFDSGESTFSFDIGLEPGSYTMALEQDGTIEAIHPILVKGYTVTTDHSSSPIADEPLTVSITTTRLQTEKTINSVELVVANQSTTIRQAASTSKSEYTVTVPATKIDNGTYTIQAVVRGHEEVRGEPELLGLSNPMKVTIQAETSSSTRTPMATTIDSGTTSLSTTPSYSTDSETDTTNQLSPNTKSKTGNAAITPYPQTTTRLSPPDPDTNTESPGFTLILAVIALLGATSLLWRNRG